MMSCLYKEQLWTAVSRMNSSLTEKWLNIFIFGGCLGGGWLNGRSLKRPKWKHWRHILLSSYLQFTIKRANAEGALPRVQPRDLKVLTPPLHIQTCQCIHCTTYTCVCADRVSAVSAAHFTRWSQDPHMNHAPSAAFAAAAASLSPRSGLGRPHNVISLFSFLFFASSSSVLSHPAPASLLPHTSGHDYAQLSLRFSPRGAFFRDRNFCGASSFLELTQAEADLSPSRKTQPDFLWRQEMQPFLSSNPQAAVAAAVLKWRKQRGR